MANEIRVTSFQKGDHICYFYRDPAEQIAVAGPFVQVGLLGGERCLCVLPKDQSAQLYKWLDSHGLDSLNEISRGALIVATPEEAYVASGSFNRELMVKFLDEAMREALKQGFTAFRGTGDLSWSALDSHACAQMPEYEAMLDRYFPGKRSLGICMYNAALFNEQQTRKLLEAHRLALLNPNAKKRAIRIRNGRAFGDVVFDRELPQLFHYTVQRDGSSEYLDVGQEGTLTAAMESVRVTLVRLSANA
jgi:hypothetical protein